MGIDGGRWIFSCDKSKTGNIWIHLVLSIIGNHFPYPDRMCGLVLSVKEKVDSVSIWIADSDQTNEQYQANLEKAASLFSTPSNSIYFQPHKAAKIQEPATQIKKSQRQASEPNIAPQKGRLLQKLKQNGKQQQQRKGVVYSPNSSPKKSASFSADAGFSRTPNKNNVSRSKNSRSYSQSHDELTPPKLKVQPSGEQSNAQETSDNSSTFSSCHSKQVKHSPLCTDITASVELAMGPCNGLNELDKQPTTEEKETISLDIVEMEQSEESVEEELPHRELADSSRYNAIPKTLLLLCLVVAIAGCYLFFL